MLFLYTFKYISCIALVTARAWSFEYIEYQNYFGYGLNKSIFNNILKKTIAVGGQNWRIFMSQTIYSLESISTSSGMDDFGYIYRRGLCGQRELEL